jgi:hypothetical protein
MDSKDVEVGKEGSLEVVEPDAVDPKNPHSTPIKRAILLAIFVNAAFIGWSDEILPRGKTDFAMTEQVALNLLESC